jgi:transposase
LCKGYKNIVEKLMPNAQVVADRFHVMSQINQELDQAIKSEKYQAKKDYKAAKTQKKNKLELRIAILQNSKYPLLKNKKKLNERQK